VKLNLATAAVLGLLVAGAGLLQHAGRGVELGLLAAAPLVGLVALRGLARARRPWDGLQAKATALALAAVVAALAVYPLPLWVAPALAAGLLACALEARARRALETFASWPRERQRRWLRAITVSSGLAFFPLAEVVVRLEGWRPWVNDLPKLTVDPPGSFYTIDPVLGYKLRAGSFVVTLEDGYAFRVTHLPDTLRITRPLETYAQRLPKPAVWVFGCSFTHGWSLNDEETYCWHVQESFPDREVVNFGVDGYGTLQSLDQLRGALDVRDRPGAIVLAYAGFHDQRNTLLRARRKQLMDHFKIGLTYAPRYAKLEGADGFSEVSDPLVFREFPLMRWSAFSHFLETKFDDLEQRSVDSHEVSRRIVRAMMRLAKERGVPFVVATIDQGEAADDMRAFVTAEGGLAVDMGVDLDEPGMSNRPHDTHPSARADRRYADVLIPALRDRALR
jgi:hypothetical protein